MIKDIEKGSKKNATQTGSASPVFDESSEDAVFDNVQAVRENSSKMETSQSLKNN